MKVILNCLLVIAILAMSYICFRSIRSVEEFDEEKESRERAIIARLVEIRKAQIEYKNVHKEHAGSFNDLIKFLNEEKLPFIIKEGVLTDEQLQAGMTEQKAVKEGLIRRDTFWVIAKDTIFGKGVNVSNLAVVPRFEDQGLTFFMDTATLPSTAGYEIKVFEASVKYDDYLGDLDPQQVYNLKDRAEKLNRFPGLRVGSLEEINNSAGNWENL